MTPIDTVNRFYQLNNDIPAGKATLEELAMLLSSDFTFTGPLTQIQGSANYLGLLRQFLSFHERVEVVKQFSNKDEVCSITALHLKTPAGGKLRMDIAEVIRVEDGKLKSHEIYYDPRAFAAAFPM